jgi:DNA polymerase-3 subunit beta
MKFIVSTSALLKNLQSVGGALVSSNVLPILDNFLFVINDGVLTITATDLQTSMTTTINVESKENGKICIPSKILMDTLKTFPEQPITFDVNIDTFGIEITTDNGKYKLAGENGDDYPEIPKEDGTSKIDLACGVLGDAIGKCLFAVSSDELRPAMTGVYCQMNNDNVLFVATDAHKLVRYKRTDAKADVASSFILPKKALTLLKNSLPDNDINVTVGYNSTHAFFNFDHLNMVCRLIDEKYPDYQAVIPTENPNKLTIERQVFLNALKRVAIFANKTTHQVRLKVAGSELNISAEDVDFSNEAFERLPCVYEGEDIEIGFNARFLVEMLSNLQSKEVFLEMSLPNRAGIILPADPEENEEVLMLVMPVMLNQPA